MDVDVTEAAIASAQTGRADAPAPLDTRGKAIILFSDGTGNSSGKLFKTNVFRLYQALDLGPDGSNERTQIAYYDNGVGTSAIRFLAILGGIFGLGLKRNVLTIYRFLCRNYNDGDKIYAFGFSRGSFTIRLLVALICQQGIVPYEDERELQNNSADAFYRFINANGPDVFIWFWLVIRVARDLLRFGWRKLRRQPINVASVHHPEIEFVGVWDTVAAYGGPISEVTRGIDKYVWPLTMTNYELNPKVITARHALALDDERDSFWPLLWDEVNEAREAVNPDNSPELQLRYATRLKQIWFAGMHSDVGGGYPDDSLAYVSLVWMLDEIGTQLRFIPDETTRIRAFANAFGPMHDSRQGLAAYYRYQPRKIAALLQKDVPDTLTFDQTRILRDPTVGEKKHRPQGLLLSCKIHDSVIERIGAGTDNYAPIVIPRDFTVVDCASLIFARGQDDAGVTTDRTAEVRGFLIDPTIAAARGEAQENAWNDVWRRRVGYFTAVALTVALIATPLYIDKVGMRPDADARWVVDIVIGWFAGFVPGIAKPWFEAFRTGYALFLIVGLILWVITMRMTAQEQQLRDRVRIAWWQAIAGTMPTHAAPGALRRFRNSFAYQVSLQRLKWVIMPLLVGVGILLTMPYVLGIVWAQVRMTQLERDIALCRNGAVVRPADAHITAFNAATPCQPLGVSVTGGARYRVVIGNVTPGGHWTDGRYAVPLGGKDSLDFPWAARPIMVFGAPFQRVVPAKWLEPLVEVRTAPQLSPLTGRREPRIAILQLKSVTTEAETKRGILVGEFTAPYAGALHFFLNDAVGPFGDPGFFYNGNGLTRNGGAASICVEAIDPRPGDAVAADPGRKIAPACPGVFATPPPH